MADQLKGLFHEASQKLDAASKKTGMPGVGDVVDKLDSIKDEAGKGHERLLSQVVGVFQDFQVTLDKALSDPTSLVPGGGCAAGLAQCYGKAVAAKLNAIKAEGSTILQLFQKIAQTIGALLQQVSSSMRSAMPCITLQVKELLGLPNALMQMAEKIEKGGIPAVAHLDMTPINESLDVSPINKPLEDIDGIKRALGPQITEMQNGVNQFSGFKTKVPNLVTSAFNVIPCFPVTAHAPAIMQELLSKLDMLKSIDLSPLLDMLNKMKFHINNFDSQKVKKPLNDFSSEAKEHTAKLTASLAEAKKLAGAATGVGSLMHGDVKGALSAFGF